MKSIIAFVLCIAAVSCGLAYEPHSGHLELARTIHADVRQEGHILINTVMMSEGGAKAYVATRKQMSRTPKWDGKDSPPLLLVKAIAIARENVLRAQPERTELLLTSLGVYMIHSDDYEHRYYYNIALQKRIPTDTGWTSQNWEVYILMDGTVIEPQLYPNK